MNDTKPKTVFEERDQLRRENERLRAQIAGDVEAMNRALSGAKSALARLAATEEALAQVQRESAELRERYEAARKVADAAVTYFETIVENNDYDAPAWCALDDAVREYRALIEPPADVEPDPCALVFYDKSKPTPANYVMCECGHSINDHGLPKGCVICECGSFRHRHICDLGHDNPSLRDPDASPLSPSKQAAFDRGIAKAEKIGETWENN